MPSAYLVTTTADSGPGSLRDAITQVNADPGHSLYASPRNPSVDEIDFAVIATSDTGGGYSLATGIATLTPHSNLPLIDNAVFIDGYTQTGALPSTLTISNNAILKVVVDGSQDNSAFDPLYSGILGFDNGLVFGSGGIVRGLDIENFSNGVGILLQGNNNTVTGCYVGTDVAGSCALGNRLAGIWVAGEGNTIGGATTGQGNVISGNGNTTGSYAGVVLADPGNFVEGNFIGLTADGNTALGNGPSGVLVAADNNVIGGLNPGTRNVIAGSANSDGIAVSPLVSVFTLQGVVIEGNYIGTNTAGNEPLANGDGVGVAQATGTLIENNLISGNLRDGITLYGSANNTDIADNKIGTDATGTHALGNGSTGLLTQSDGVTIHGNLISANGSGVQINGGYGILLVGNNNTVTDCSIGTDVSGTVALGNQDDGICVEGSGNTIGGTAGQGNVISGNGLSPNHSYNGQSYGNAGIELRDSGNLVAGNYIGTDAAGEFALPNAIDGVDVEASDNVIGGTTAAGRNVISGNGDAGIRFEQFASGVVVQGNYIGTDAAGAAALGNAFDGIYMTQGAANNRIGGTATGAGNVISGNLRIGVLLDSSVGPNTTIEGNYVGTDATGMHALGNGGSGLYTQASFTSFIGNLVSGNGVGMSPVEVNGQGGIQLISEAWLPLTGITVQGNRIGTDATGNPTLGNFGDGVLAYSYHAAVTNTLIGGSAPGAANVIAGNTGAGVGIDGGYGNRVQGNSIFANKGLGIDLGDNGVNANADNDALGHANNSNQLMNFPVLTSVSASPSSTTVTGTLDLNTVGGPYPAGTQITLDFYANTALDGAGYRQGKTWLGSYTVIANGTASMSFTAGGLAAIPADLGYVTATATDADGNTSEFFQPTPVPPGQLRGLVWQDDNNDGQVDFGEKAIQGVAITVSGTDYLDEPIIPRTAYTDIQGIYAFPNLLPGTYTLSETQPAGFADGRDTLGTVNGQPSGDASVNDRFGGIVLPPGGDGMNFNFGERPVAGGSVSGGQSATIGFWQNGKGQALLRSLNGGAGSTQLGNWLAATFPHLYGAAAGSNNLTGKSNIQVANYYTYLFKQTGQNSPGRPTKLDAQVLAIAFAVYVTDQQLAGTAAAAYGFKVTADGVGYATFNVGTNGPAFGVADHSTVTVLDLLQATDARTHNGLLYDQDGSGTISTLEQTLRGMANQVYTAINEQGGV